MNYDYAVIGAGIVGLAVAHKLQEIYPDSKILILEKESQPAMHQSGRNSGVIHSGIYYKPGSLKAFNCRRGRKLLLEFADRHAVPYKLCGKLIVATNLREQQRLSALLERGLANDVKCRLINPQEIKEFEPYAAGIQAIHVEDAGVIDYREVCRKLAWLLEKNGTTLVLNSRVLSISNQGNLHIIDSTTGTYQTKTIINAAGLYSDYLADIDPGISHESRIVPFRGEYYAVRTDRDYLCRNLIYPVPNPDFPFLGVHFTRDINNTVDCGPNAVFALAREGYKWSNVSFKETFSSLSYIGFWKFTARYWREGLDEIYRSLSKKYFLKSLQRLIPDIKEDDLLPANSGVRAQAMIPSGKLHDDFIICKGKNSLHILNAPSPAATSCLSIAQYVADYLSE